MKVARQFTAGDVHKKNDPSQRDGLIGLIADIFRLTRCIAVDIDQMILAPEVFKR
jgi:hypothetical protein